MKKVFAILLASAMLVTVFTGCAKNPADDPTTSPDNTTKPVNDPTQTTTTEPVVVEPTGQFIVGTNVINGNFFTGWDNLVGNSNVKSLINGYATVAYTEDDQWIIDPMVVKDFQTTENADGSKTYSFVIHDDLMFNDGTPITAKHYVFSALYNFSPLLLELECDRFTGSDVVNGAIAYNDGETDVLTGLRLLGEYEFSMTVDAETYGDANFPYFWELAEYAGASPLPMHILAPGCDVEDTGNGVKMTGPWSLDLVRDTLDNGETGYRYTPTVTCGYYNFISYDENNTTVILEANPYFKGRYDGAKPLIKTLIIKQTETATQMDMLSTGTIELLLQLSGAENINAGLDLVDQGLVNFTTYSRNGYGRIVLKCDRGPTQFEEVRRAIAYCLDREEFVRQYTGGYGVIANSRYGLAQWTYQENKDYVDRELTLYSLNVDKALEELVAGGWIYNANGGEYTSGIRHKQMDDGTYMPLVIEWFSPDSNKVGTMLNTFLVGNAEAIGFKFNQTFGNNTAFSDALYDANGAYYNMINGGVGFGNPDTPWYYYDISLPAMYNMNRIDDEILYDTSIAMRLTESTDKAGYSEKWLEFIMRYNEILPDIPLYSDEYHDFFNDRLKNYNPTALWPWYEAIITAYVEG